MKSIMVSGAPLTSNLALLSAGLLGFRHGFDYDHIAAISDIASVQKNSRQAMKMGSMYALGHAATVAVLGLAVIIFQLSLPSAIDASMERIVGITLLILGAYVLWTTIFQPRTVAHQHSFHPPRTRITIMFNALLWCVWRVRQTFSSQPVRRFQLLGGGIGKAPAFVVGVIHGLGAETPTQLLLFLLAANLGGVFKGVIGLTAFIIGMLVMNTLMCATAAGTFKVSMGQPRTFQWVAGLSAAYSMIIGTIFLAGTSTFAAILGK